MEIKSIDAPMFAKMFLAGAKNLDAKKEWINELNVFPVPDGDTGTNMSMTIMAAAKEVSALEEITMSSLAKAISSGSLRGARGNSGVILSQLFRGFTRALAGERDIDVYVLAYAMQRAVETAYKAVMKPKEGTILTVARGAAERALELLDEENEDLVYFWSEMLHHAEDVLSQTPEMLPVLKQAGVVDSGGQGLVEVFRGSLDVLMGKEVDYTIEGVSDKPKAVPISAQTEADIKYGYCTEFIIVSPKGRGMTEQEELNFKHYLEDIGDSIVVVCDDEITKVHVHTNDPGLALQRALVHGSLTSLKIDNMREEHEEKLIKDAEKVSDQQKAEDQEKIKQLEEKILRTHKDIGFITVSIGEGINEIFKGLGADYIIPGGQTMNPSTEDMLNAIDKVPADHIFILPNNKNIILAANQAASLTDHKNIIVIPTMTVPQGITALINFMPEQSAEENAERMNKEIGNVKTGQVTYAVRDTIIDDKVIKQGDYMGIGDSSILSVGKDMDKVTREMVNLMMDEESSVISIYYGADVFEKDAKKLVEELQENYPDCDIELHAGGQPIYFYVISVE